MSWWRKSLVHFLSLLLFLSLIGGAYATSANIAFRHPDKVKVWLKQSNIYGHFVANTITQGQKSAGDQQTGTVSLSDSAVQQAAQNAFSSQMIEQNVDKFLDANYNWLAGKTDKPVFTIDLSQAKQTFADQVAQYTQTRLAALPVCTPTQLTQIQASSQAIDPLSISCRPSYLTPEASAAQVKQQIEQSSDFLSNPEVNADNFAAAQGKTGEPYYKKLSSAPTLYKLDGFLPWLSALLAALAAFGVIMLAATKRRGLRKVAISFGLAGLVLVAGKFIADAAFHRAEKQIFNNSSVGQLQQSLTDFFHRAESQLVRVDLYFGVVFLALAVAVLIYLITSRSQSPKSAADPTPAESHQDPAPVQSAPQSPVEPASPPKPKSPRLIQ
jgi:DNA-binding protein Fis